MQRGTLMSIAKILSVATSVAFAVLVSPAQGASLTVLNASFETGTPGSHSAQLPSTAGFYSDWLFGCGSASVCGSSGISAIGFAPDGSQVGFTSNGGTPGGTSFIAQDIAAIVPGATYTLSVMVGRSLSFPLTGYQLTLGYNSTPNDPNTNVPFQSTLFIAPGDIPAAGDFILASITGIAPLFATGDVTIEFGSGSLALWDQATLTVNQVPVPAALPLFATGLGGLAFLARRRKKQTA
jgi:hypothetical protein